MDNNQNENQGFQNGNAARLLNRVENRANIS